MQMDICSHTGFPVNDVSSLHGSCMDTLKSNCELAGYNSVDELAYRATKILKIQDDVEAVSGSTPHEKGVFQLENECPEANQKKIITETPEKLFSKCTTSVGGTLNWEMNDKADVITSEVSTPDDNGKSMTPCCSSTSSLPNCVRSVSAIKGSREKRGTIPAKKLSVKWAPNVYNPLPASSLHMVINSPRKHGKKSSKSKQKKTSKSSPRGGKGKEKKQVRKRSGTVNPSDMGFKLYEQKEELIHVSEIHQPSDIDFRLGIPDHSCGGSFVSRYGHLTSVTEAT